MRKNIHSSKSFIPTNYESAWEEGFEVVHDDVSESFLLVFSSFVSGFSRGEVGGTFSLFNA